MHNGNQGLCNLFRTKTWLETTWHYFYFSFLFMNVHVCLRKHSCTGLQRPALDSQETCTLGLEFLQFENVLACATFLDPTFLGKTC